MIELGVITAKISHARMQHALASLETQCTFRWLVYDALPHVLTLYQQQTEGLDGLLFSGPLPRRYLERQVGVIGLPCAYCDVSEGDLYKLFVEIAVNYPQTDFSRVFVDSGIPAQWFADIFPPDKYPLVDKQEAPFAEQLLSFDSDTYAVAEQRILSLWRGGAIDLVITRMTNLARRLSDQGVPHGLLQPSARSIRETAGQLELDITQRKLEDAMTVVTLVEPMAAVIDQAVLQEALERFNVLSDMVYIIRQSDGLFEMSLSHSVFKKVTDGYRVSPLHRYLNETFEDEYLCAAGIGPDAVTARMNALRALGEARHHPGKKPVVVTHDGRVIAPADSQPDMPAYAISENIKNIASRVEMSPFNLQRIVSLINKSGSNQVTSEDLASYLGIRQRSAARILGRLEAAGLARLVKSRQMNTRGRPAKVYEISMAAELAR